MYKKNKKKKTMPNTPFVTHKCGAKSNIDLGGKK
jgi:hypothetical protein